MRNSVRIIQNHITNEVRATLSQSLPPIKQKLLAAWLDRRGIPHKTGSHKGENCLHIPKNHPDAQLLKDGFTAIVTLALVPECRAVFDVTKDGRGVLSPLRWNVIEVSESIAKSHGIVFGQAASLFFHGKLTECTIIIRPDIKGNQIRLTKWMQEELQWQDPAMEAYVILPKDQYVSNITIQMVEKVKDGLITLNAQAYDQLPARYDKLVINHVHTGAKLCVPKRFIDKDSALKKGTVRLNYYHRQLLNLPELHKESYTLQEAEMIRDRIKRTGRMDIPEKINALLEQARAETQTDLGSEFIQLLKESGYTDLQLSAVFDEKEPFGLKFGKAIEKLCDFFAGGCEVLLKTGRPYQIDENRDIVRISPDNAALLGIEETDQVILKHKNRSVKAKAMIIDSFEFMKKTNILSGESELETMIGIPAHIRRRLRIGDLETVVTVKRDSPYLFIKNLNIQFLPVIALWLTLFQISDDYLKMSVIFLVCLPFVVYIMLSTERSKVKKLKD